MGCGTGLGRLLLVLLNLVILLVSLAVLAVGILLKFFAGVVTKLLLGTTSALSSADKTRFNIPDVSDIESLPFVSEIGVALIIFGVILFCISFFGCCGACCKYRPLLIVFVVLLSILVIAQAVIGGLFLAKESILHKTIKDKVGDKVKTDFVAKGNDVFSFSINIMQYLMGCCGIRGWEDFPGAKPPSCCNKTIIDGRSPDWDIQKAACYSNPTTAPASYYSPKGCYVLLQDKVLDHLTIAGVILAVILFVQVLEILFACLIVKDVNDHGKVGPY